MLTSTVVHMYAENALGKLQLSIKLGEPRIGRELGQPSESKTEQLRLYLLVKDNGFVLRLGTVEV